MFGLMKACSCHKTSEEREVQRMHYCGTCKTIGRLYGQKSRLFLNYDAVFLGEVLSDLQPSPISFAPAYVSKNCLALPQARQIPWALEYAAAANVVLAQFKLLDHVADTGSRLLRIAVRAYSHEFELASQALARCNFPFKDLVALISLQNEREREARPRMERLSQPTAGATRLVFRHGAFSAGASSGVVDSMADLGHRFGEIAYLADAIQDQKKDTEKGEFNALSATGMSSKSASRLLAKKQDEMIHLLYELPITDSRKREYASRLKTNLAPHLFQRRRPDRVIVVRERGPGVCGSCAQDICCCETIQCCDCIGPACCECICSGCAT